MSDNKAGIKTTYEIATIIRDKLVTLAKADIISFFEQTTGNNLYYMGDSMWTLDVKDLIGFNIDFVLPGEGFKKVSGKITKIDSTNAEVIDNEGKKHSILTEHINNLI